MKKIYFILLLVVAVFAIALADNTDKVLRIYHGGNITNIPLSEIEKISHSKYDAEGTLSSDNVTTVIQSIGKTYQIPINSIDDIFIVDTNDDRYEQYIEMIDDHIFSQEEREVGQFQKELIDWLNNQDWVLKTKINEKRDLIKVTLNIGKNYYINFQDMSFFSREDITGRKSLPTPQDFYDVSSMEEEKIIDNTNVLLIQGLDWAFQYGLFWLPDTKDYATNELAELETIKSNSPVYIKLTPTKGRLSFLDNSVEDYGMIIVSQTHGTEDFGNCGAFQVDYNKEDEKKYQLDRGINISTEYGEITPHYRVDYIIKKSRHVFWVLPKFQAESGTIIYGRYCYSYNMASNNPDMTIFGWENSSNNQANAYYLNHFVNTMLNGGVFSDAIGRPNDLPDYYSPLVAWAMASSNKPKSNQRYFSIKTNDLEYEKGEVIISGQIKGYKNLKPGYNRGVIYEHEGAEDFTPVDLYVKKYNVDINEEDGTFEARIPSSSREYNTEYGYMFGFDKYYGETKTIPLYSLTTYSVYDSDIEGTTVTVNGKLYGDLSRNGSVGFYYAEVVGTPHDPTELEREYVTVANSLSGLQDGEFSFKLTGLKPNTQYAFNTFALVEGNWFYGNFSTFNTRIDVETGDYTLDKDDPTKATLFGSIPKYSPLDMDGQDIEVGFVYDKYPSLNFYNDNRIRVYPIGNANFSGLAEDLEESTTYYYRAYLKMGDFINYGEEKSFTTEQWLKIQTLDATNRTTDAATLNGQVQHLDKLSGRYELGFYYGTNNNLSISTAKYVTVPNNQQNDGVFSVTINNLNPKTDYYFAAAIKIRGEVMLGNVMKIQSPKEYTVQTVGSKNVKTTSATLLGLVDGFQKADVSGNRGEVGFLISTLSTLAIDNSNATCIKVANLQDLNTGSFSTAVKQLQSNTVYYYRAYVTGNGYVNYGEIKTLTTSIEVNIATVSATDVTSSSAQLNGSLEGLASLKDHYQIGFYYGNSAELDPSSAQFVTMTQQSGNNFSAVIDNLKPETDYYFKAAIKINDDIQCGDVKMLHTLQKDMVTTVGNRNLKATSVTLMGQVKDFQQEIFANIQGEVGFVIGTSNTLSVNSLSNTQIKVSGIPAFTSGDFTADVDGLQEQTTYYYAAYIIADNKVSYGEVKEFTTPRLLNIITLGAGNIKSSSAQVLGQAINLNTVTGTYTLGFYYSMDSNPGPSNGTYVQSEYTDDTDGTFFASLSGLEGDTKYYYVAVIQVGGETIYAEDIRSFQTEKARPGVADPVDLGLSVKWASWNMGATAPEELGGMYAIGELQPKEEFSWENYQVSTDIKGCFSATQYDAAYNTWGKDWRLPTREEIIELLRNSSTYTEQNGVNGLLITATNGNSIFLPDPKFTYNGCYLSGNCGTSNVHTLNFYNGRTDVVPYENSQRYQGFLIRPVYDPTFKEMSIETLDASDLKVYSATINGKIENPHWKNATEVGFYYNTTGNPKEGNGEYIAINKSGEFSYTLNDLTPATTYYYVVAAKVLGTTYYAEAKSFTTVRRGVPSTSQLVDLGLSVNWAGRNVGASSPTERGTYFQWGMTYEPAYVDYYAYEYRDGDNSSTGRGKDIGENISGTKYDAARANWGGSWRMPTMDEWAELLDRCTIENYKMDGIEGISVTGPNGNCIFLPITGEKWFGTVRDLEYYLGHYWSSINQVEYNQNRRNLKAKSIQFSWRDDKLNKPSKTDHSKVSAIPIRAVKNK